MKDAIGKKYKFFLINMDRAKDRLASVQCQMDALGLSFDRIVGVDVSKMPVSALYERYSILEGIKGFYRPLNMGEIGCYISHQNAWKQLLEEDLDFAIIIEDDILINKDTVKILDFMQKHYEKWDFLRLQCEKKSKAFYNVDFEEDGFKIVEFIKSTGTTFAYALKKDTAKVLLDKLVPFGLPADTNMHIYGEYGVEVKALRPFIASWGKDSGKSQISIFAPKKSVYFSYFARKIFSTKSYFSRIRHLLSRDGVFKFSFRLMKMLFSKKTINYRKHKDADRWAS